jgi:4Fe-4S ferredoxin
MVHNFPCSTKLQVIYIPFFLMIPVIRKLSMQSNYSGSLNGTAICKEAIGNFRPVIDRNRCEGKAGCVAVCPYNVFSIESLPPLEWRALSARGKLKGLFHGWKQAFTPNADACHACGLCVSSCPEHAITQQRVE